MTEFDKFMQNAFENQYKEKKEGAKVEILQTLRKLVGEFYTQMIKGIEDPLTKLEKSRLVTFMPNLTDHLIAYLTDYHDNVREQAQNIAMDIVKNFIPFNPDFSKAQEDSLNMLRANIQVGWTESMKTQVKNAADMEAELNKHLFADPQVFLKNIIAIMIDETHGRDVLVMIVKEFNRRTPFMLMNDFRIALGTNSLRRIEILKELIFKY